jgi:hypothetical protein
MVAVSPHIAPASAAIAVVDDLLSERPNAASDALHSRQPGEIAALARFLRQVIILNLSAAEPDDAGLMLENALCAPSPATRAIIRSYIERFDFQACPMCAPDLTGLLAGTVANLYRDRHGNAALAAWRGLRDAVLPSHAQML